MALSVHNVRLEATTSHPIHCIPASNAELATTGAVEVAEIAEDKCDKSKHLLSVLTQGSAM